MEGAGNKKLKSKYYKLAPFYAGKIITFFGILLVNGVSTKPRYIFFSLPTKVKYLWLLRPILQVQRGET